MTYPIYKTSDEATFEAHLATLTDPRAILAVRIQQAVGKIVQQWTDEFTGQTDIGDMTAAFSAGLAYATADYAESMAETYDNNPDRTAVYRRIAAGFLNKTAELHLTPIISKESAN